MHRRPYRSSDVVTEIRPNGGLDYWVSVPCALGWGLGQRQGMAEQEIVPPTKFHVVMYFCLTRKFSRKYGNCVVCVVIDLML